MKSKGCEQSKVMITIRMDYSGPFESESALKYISSSDEVTHDNKPLTAGSIVPLPVRPFLFFFCRLMSNAFPCIGSVDRSDWKKEKPKKRKKNSRSLWIWGLVPQHHCCGAWKQQDTNPKEYGGSVGWCYCNINPLTPKIWLLILPSICYIFTSNLCCYYAYLTVVI